MHLVTMSKSDHDRLAAFALIPGEVDESDTVDNGDGTITFPICDETAERLKHHNPDLAAAVIEIMDLLASGQTLGRAN